MDKRDKMPFLEMIVFGVIFCLHYRDEHSGIKRKLTVHDIQESMKMLIGNDSNFHDIEHAVETLVSNDVIDSDLEIQDGTIENSFIEFRVKQNISDNIRNSYADRKRLIDSVIRIMASCRNKKIPELEAREVQIELKNVSGVTVKQSEIKIVLDSLSKEPDRKINLNTIKYKLKEITKLVYLKHTASIGIWSLVTFGVICCLRKHPEYIKNDKILEENVVLHIIGELIHCNAENIWGFDYGDIKKELIENKLINRTLNITVQDISEGRITINPRLLVGPIFASIDFLSLVAFYALYLLNRELPGDKKPGYHEIAEQMKHIGKELDLKNIDRRNVPFVISFLYAQGIINDKFKITIPDLHRFRFFINDLKMTKSDGAGAKELFIQHCLTQMGCDDGRNVELKDGSALRNAKDDGMEMIKHHPFTAPAFAKLDFVSFLAFHALYLIGRKPSSDIKIAERMKRIAGEHKYELKNVDRKNVPLIISNLYAQGIINEDSVITIPDLCHFRFIIKDMDMDMSEKDSSAVTEELSTKKNLIKCCLTRMGCDAGGMDEPANETSPDDNHDDQTLYDDGGLYFHRFRSEEIECHEQVLIDCLHNKDFLKKLVGEEGEAAVPKFPDDDPVFAELKKGQKFLWECFNARTNEGHKEFYKDLAYFVSRFVYENTLFLESLLGIKEPYEISKRLGINVPNAGKLRDKSKETEAVMNLADAELNGKSIDSLLARIYRDTMDEEYKDMSMKDEISEALEDNRPTIKQKDGISGTKDFVKLVKLIDGYDASRETAKILKDFELGKDSEDFMPFIEHFRVDVSSALTDPERKKLNMEDQNRKSALYVLLYCLYRLAKDNNN